MGGGRTDGRRREAATRGPPRAGSEDALAERSDDTADRRFANTLARGLSVLAAYRPGDHKLGNKELAERTGLPKSIVSRLTFTLSRLGYLNQDGPNERYRLGPALLALGNIATASSTFAGHIDASMQGLADATGTLAVMSMRDRGELVLLRRWPPAGAPRHGWLPVGHQMPLLASSAGHARLSGVAPRSIESVGVIGGGTMGAGIATALLLSGLPVILSERDAPAAAQARARVRGHLQGAQKRGKLATDDLDAWLDARLKTCTGLDALAAADLIIEAAFEDMAVKAAIFADLDRIARPGAVLATDTSYLDIDALAAPLSRPEAVLGLHFFTPAHVMRLLEVVEGARTAPEVLATGFALARPLGRIAVRAGVCDGCIGNRILSQYLAAADHMVLDGTDPELIDAPIRDFGFPLGPFELSDLSGLDIGAARRKRLAPTREPRDRVPHHADALCAVGALGARRGGAITFTTPKGGGRDRTRSVP